MAASTNSRWLMSFVAVRALIPATVPVAIPVAIPLAAAARIPITNRFVVAGIAVPGVTAPAGMTTPWITRAAAVAAWHRRLGGRVVAGDFVADRCNRYQQGDGDHRNEERVLDQILTVSQMFELTDPCTHSR